MFVGCKGDNSLFLSLSFSHSHFLSFTDTHAPELNVAASWRVRWERGRRLGRWREDWGWRMVGVQREGRGRGRREGNSSGKDWRGGGGGGTCQPLFYSHPGVSERRQIPADYSTVLSNTKAREEKKERKQPIVCVFAVLDNNCCYCCWCSCCNSCCCCSCCHYYFFFSCCCFSCCCFFCCCCYSYCCWSWDFTSTIQLWQLVRHYCIFFSLPASPHSLYTLPVLSSPFFRRRLKRKDCPRVSSREERNVSKKITK